MPAPTNISSATAIVINGNADLPYSNSQTVDDAGTTYTVWYRFDCDFDGVIGLWAFGDLVTYKPTIRIRKNNPVGAVYLSYQNRPVYMAAETGMVVWIEIQTNAGNPSPADLAFSVLRHAEADVPSGSIGITDTVNTYPFALLSATVDNTVLAYIQGADIVGSEYGACILPSGILCIGDSSQVVLYDASYNTIAFTPPIGGTDCYWVGSNNTDRFYVSSGWPFSVGSDTVFTVDDTGVQGPDTWVLTGSGGNVRGIAPSPDETILYYITQFFDDTNTPVKRWDLVNDVALSDLAAGINADTYVTSNLLCLADGTVLVGYRNDVAETQFIRHYSAAGAVLDTYDITAFWGNGGNADLLARDTTDASFWIWLHAANVVGATQYFLQIRISDGTILTTRTATHFDAGRYNYAATATPLARFGYSYSCPFWITRGVETGTIVVTKETIGGDTRSFDFEAGGGLSPSTFSLADGDSQTFEDVAAGDGYSLTETFPPGWSATAVVSNGTLNNIVVVGGETTTITITNTAFANGPEALEQFEAAGLLKAFDVPRVRTAPHLADENQRIFYSRFELDLESGAGTVTGQGVDPVVLLRYSNDGGFTWSAWRQLSVGRLGQYKYRCDTWNLGMARDRVFQLRQTDPVKSAWLTAYIDFSDGTS